MPEVSDAVPVALAVGAWMMLLLGATNAWGHKVPAHWLRPLAPTRPPQFRGEWAPFAQAAADGGLVVADRAMTDAEWWALQVGAPVARDATTLRAQYVALAKRFHPDAGGDESTMRRVTQTYDALRRALEEVA